MNVRSPWPALACAAAVLCTGCGGGVTVEGRPTNIATRPSYAHPTPSLRTPSPSVTPTEDRRTTPGPEIAYRTPQGEALLRVITYSWQQTGFGEKSVAPTNRYLVLDVEITVTTGSVAVLPFNLKATPAGGQPVEPTFGRDGHLPVLATKTLPAGESLRGFVVFDIPQADTALTVLDELGAGAGETHIPPL